MQEENLNSLESATLTGLRIVPRAGFARDLGADIRRAATRRMGRRRAPVTGVVIELRKLVRLLRETLVPVRPRAEFAESLGSQLQERALALSATRHQRWRWLMVGGVVGSLLSLVGVIAALLLHRRSAHLHAGETPV